MLDMEPSNSNAKSFKRLNIMFEKLKSKPETNTVREM